MMRAVDLFAGCGGLSLGLEWAGFEATAAIERSDMAAETHFRNFNLRGKPFDRAAWDRLLRASIAEQARLGTVVQDIWDVVGDAEAMDYFAEEVKPALVAGGPPCQGFSMAGRRDPSDVRNQLPWAFLEFVERVRPRAVVIENVVGINRSFRKAGADAPFEQLRQALAATGPGYVVQPVELNARHYGIPQNRPRMMLIAVDRATAELAGLDVPDAEPWSSAEAFKQGRAGEHVAIPRLAPLPQLDDALTVQHALCDLDGDGYAWEEEDPRYLDPIGAFARQMRMDEAGSMVPTLANHVHRNHTHRVTERFRLYRFLRDEDLPNSLLGIPFQYDSPMEVRMALKRALDGRSELPDGLGQPGEDLVDVIVRLRTKKHTQRAIHADRPAPTVVTLPDDYVHPDEPRIMTVRELARFQSFPDWFEFRNKETTGAHRRKVEVPQFSQVGNAVPPLLGKAVGLAVANVLAAADSNREASALTELVA